MVIKETTFRRDTIPLYPKLPREKIRSFKKGTENNFLCWFKKAKNSD
jgi:hypothetical protein